MGRESSSEAGSVGLVALSSEQTSVDLRVRSEWHSWEV